MYGVGVDVTPIHLRAWSRWPEILWRRSSTRGPLADQLLTREAAATIYAAGAVTATVDTVSRVPTAALVNVMATIWMQPRSTSSRSAR